jgi:hypothetical protein
VNARELPQSVSEVRAPTPGKRTLRSRVLGLALP